MLTVEESKELTGVGPGTPMGNFFREFWFPALPTSEVPETGGRPIRLKLLGEDLVMFRNSQGKVGLLGERCAHRRTSLIYGRNEDSGLRCVYHGWLFGIDGSCIETPAEPVFSQLHTKIKQPAYPCEEVNGTVWVYMGSSDNPPRLPDYGLATMPADKKVVQLSVRDCNWLQALEGDVDLTHGAYLHSSVDPTRLGENHLDRYNSERPRSDAVATPYGVAHAIRRGYDDEHDHLGVGHFLFPFMTNFPPVGDAMKITPGHVWVPMDDFTTLVWSYTWDSDVTSSDPPRRISSNPSVFDLSWEARDQDLSKVGGAWRQRGNFSNDYGFDYAAQQTVRYSGLPSVELQDRAMQESMGPIADRWNENLGSIDLPQKTIRARLISSAREFAASGKLPECTEKPQLFSVRSASGLIPRNLGTESKDWIEISSPWIKDEPGIPAFSKGHRLMQETQEPAPVA